MKTFIIFLLFVPIVLFAAVAGRIAKKAAQAPKTFDLKSYVLPLQGESPKSDDAKLMAGWKVYTSKGCVFCHGPNGAGGVKNPGAVGGLIPSLVAVGEGFTAEELKDKIRRGVKSENMSADANLPPALYMPSWKDNLTDQELDDLVHYLMSLAPKQAKEESWE